MVDITLPMIKTVLLSFGYDHVQTLPLNSPKPDTLHIVLKKKDINWRVPIGKHLKEFENVFGPVTYGNTNRKTHTTDCDYLEIGKYRIFASLKEHKVVAVQAGKSNELVLYNTINEYLKQYESLNIKFLANGKMYFVADVNEVIHAAHDTSGRRKADINLQGAFSGTFSLSLKEPKFAAWEAIETYWKDKKNVLEYALDTYPSKVSLEKIGNEYYLQPSIAVKCSSNEARDVIFGSDILGKGLVVSQSWKSGHFDWDHKSRTLILDCENVLQAMSDVDSRLWPYFQLRNHGGHKSKFLEGIAANAVPFENLSPSDLILPNNARSYSMKHTPIICGGEIKVA